MREETVKKGKKKGWLAAGIILGILALAIGVAVFMMAESVNSYNAVYPGVNALGMDLSGMSRQEVKTAVLEKSKEDYKDQSFILCCGDVSVCLTAEEADIRYDADKLADEAYYASRNDWIVKRYLALHGHSEEKNLEVSVLYSTEKVSEKVDEFLSLVCNDTVQPSYEVKDGLILLDLGEEGHSIDRETLINELTGRVESQTFGEYQVEVTVEEPEELDLEAIHREQISEPVPAAIQYVPLSWTEETADQWTEKKLEEYSGLHKYVITEGHAGLDFDLEAAKEKVASAEEGKRYISIPLILTEPEEGVSSIESRLFKDVLATWTTKLDTKEVNRTHNIDLASASVNGSEICPGDIFSYNDVVGARTAARGYRDAKIFVSGEVVDGIGGGICQLSSTIYIAILRAGLEPTERYSHRFAVSYTALGQDATVAWGSLDFKFKNTSAWPIRLAVSRAGGNLTVTVYGTKEDNYTYDLSSTQEEVIDYEVKTVYLQLGSAQASAKGLTTLGQSKKSGGKLGYKSSTYIIKKENGQTVSTSLVNHSTYKTQAQTVYIAAYLDAAGQPYLDAAGNLYDPNAAAVTDPTTQGQTLTDALGKLVNQIVQ